MSTSKRTTGTPIRAADGSIPQKQIMPPHPTMGHYIDPRMPLHKLFIERYHKGRDLKIIITANNSETGTGKTTLAFFLADQWNQMYADSIWKAETNGTLDIYEYLDQYRNLSPGNVMILDEAEELDARRSNSNKNVEFSKYWMKMRVRQVTSILTLPTKTALDSRLEELADVWIEVQRRGKALAHDIQSNPYSEKVVTWKVHNLEWPNVADHPQMRTLHRMKEENIEEGITQSKREHEEEQVDPKEIRREQKIEIAQHIRDQELTVSEVAELVDMSEGWVSNNTEHYA